MDYRFGAYYNSAHTVVHREQIVEVPQVVYEEQVRHQTRHEVQQRLIQIPKVEYQERIEYVDVVEYREVPVDKIVEVPEVEYRVREVEQLVPQTFVQEVFNDHYVEVPVCQIQEVMRKEEVPVFPGQAEVRAKKQAAERLSMAQEQAVVAKQEAQAAKQEAAEARRLLEQMRMELDFVKANAAAGAALVAAPANAAAGAAFVAAPAPPMMPRATFLLPTTTQPLSWEMQQQQQLMQQQQQQQMQMVMTQQQVLQQGQHAEFQQQAMQPQPTAPTRQVQPSPSAKTFYVPRASTVSMDEVAAIFDSIDQDHDGCITKEEGEALLREVVQQKQQSGALYANYNPATVSPLGMSMVEAERLFDSLDQGKGFITQEDFLKAQQRLVNNAAARHQSMPSPGPATPPLPPPVFAPWGSMPVPPGAGHMPMGGGSVAVPAF